MSSEDDVTEDDRDSAGVELGVLPCALARASASETAERYEAAVFSTGVDFFLNMDGVGDADWRAIGEGMVSWPQSLRSSVSWSFVKRVGGRRTATSGVAVAVRDQEINENRVSLYDNSALCQHG